MAERRVVAAGEPQQRNLSESHDAVRDGKDRRIVATRERRGHAECRYEQRGHRGEDRDPNGPLLRVHDAREPRVPDPTPPKEAQHEHSPREAGPGRVICHQRRALGYRQYEDEVEEELERRDPLVLAQGGGEPGCPV